MHLSIGSCITVGITEEDIRRGVPGKSAECPITLACGRAVQPHLLDYAGWCGWRGVTSNTHYILSVDVPLTYKFALPNEAKRFLWQFDHRIPVEPLTFEMELTCIRDPNEPR